MTRGDFFKRGGILGLFAALPLADAPTPPEKIKWVVRDHSLIPSHSAARGLLLGQLHHVTGISPYVRGNP